MRAIVVDHHTDVASWIVTELETRGASVRVANDAAAALAAISAFTPSVMLVEIALHDMNGWELARRIRRLCGDGTPRLIAISALDHPTHHEQSRLAGFDHHLVKPLRPDKLATAVFGEG
ncbi:MAG TPA: response regulator [Kofleriaceae bacterium]|jgi:DNA-binding response OmpR family regulator